MTANLTKIIQKIMVNYKWLMVKGRKHYAPTKPQLNDRRGVLHTPNNKINH